jgi:uncharacterized membrane protein YdjX (TVP38/TMEM64 family)
MRYLPLALVAAGLGAAVLLGVTDYLSLSELQARRDALQAYVAEHPVLSLGLYALAYFLVVAFSLPGGTVMTLTGGFLFGTWIGGSAAIISATLGAVVLFLAARSAFGDALRGRAGSAVGRVAEGVRRNAFSYLLTLRLLPVFPFWLVNLAAGFVDVPLRTFAVTTFIGIIPGTFIYAGLGAGLGSVFERGQALNLGLIFEPQILLPLIGLAVLALLPVVWNRVRARSTA